MTAISTQPGEAPTRPPRPSSAQLDQKVVFAALEYGAAWPIDAGVSCAWPPLRQLSSESAGDFAKRVGRELTGLCGRRFPGGSIAALSLASGITSEQISARCAIGAGLLRCFAQSDIVFLLTCDARASRDERAHVLALAEGLSEGQIGRRVLVRFSNLSHGLHGQVLT